MTETHLSDPSQEAVPPPPDDAHNPALIDLEKTFKIAVVAAILFCVAALFIIISTRSGG